MKIVIGVDDSACSDAAIDHVTRAAWPKATTFLVVSAAAPIVIGPGEVTAVDAISRLMEDNEKYHKEIAERAATRLRKAELTADPRLVRGDPRTALVDTARSEHADLMVVGSHGRTGIKKLLLGSVASHVVAHAPCSVLVVKEGVSHGG
jgi:nucleotide-binding universal stress UspA family protein